MNRLQANLCLLCVTLCWSAEVVLYACIPDGVPAFATSAVTALAGAALLLAPFHRRVAEELKASGWRFAAAVFGLAALSAAYNTLYLYGAKSFDVASGAFTFCMTVVILPVVLLTMRRRVEPGTWVSVVLVLAGIVLALGPSVRASQAPGLGLMGAGCLLRAVAVVDLADAAKKHDLIVVAILLEGFAALISFAGWAAEDPRLFTGLPSSRTLVAVWAVYSYFIVALAQTLNVFAMRRVTAVNATIVYSVEIIFSIAWGALLPAGIADHALRWTSIAGFATNFIGPYLLWLFWTRVSRTPFSLRTPRDLLRQCLALVAMAAVEDAILAPSVALVYPEVDIRFFAVSVFCNTAAFPIVIGIPLSILMQEEFGFVPAGRGPRP